MLEIGDQVQILAGADAGVFYGTETVLQLLRSRPVTGRCRVAGARPAAFC